MHLFLGELMQHTVFQTITRVCFIWILCFLLLPIFSFSGQIYRWVDEEGTVHMTEDLATIPPQFRDKTKKKTLESTIESGPGIMPRPYPGTINTNRSLDGLKQFEISYQGFEGSSRRIIVPVTFNDSVTAHLLVDTGAPSLMISPQLAEKLGILEEQDNALKITAGGIGGSVPAMLAVVDSVRIGEATAEFLPATIAPIPSDAFEGLVGMDFLSNYRISIDSTRSVIAFDELPARQERPGGHDEAWWRTNFRIIERSKSEWRQYLASLENINTPSNETESIKKLAEIQYAAAERFRIRLEKFASDNAVPNNWRH
jgi:predicted aspartyl protease